MTARFVWLTADCGKNNVLAVILCRGVYITYSVLVDLGIRSSCAIGNNELEVTRD